MAECEDYNARLASGDLPVPLSLRLRWLGRRAARERAWRDGAGRREPLLILAIVEHLRVFYFSAVAFKIVGDACQMFSPILARCVVASRRLPSP